LILLSFDIEEFDMPFEYNRSISFEEQISISKKGTIIILDLLLKHQIKATFFSTVTFAKEVPDLIERIVKEGHELASHGVYHSQFEDKHLLESKLELEKLSGLTINGFRMPRMRDVNNQELYKSNYKYNSSLNPTWLPGRYNHLDKPRDTFKQEGILQIPASVSPLLRFPLFWLSFHNLPLALYKYLALKAHRKDGYINVYFHPWEFTDLKNKEKFGFPSYVSKNSGEKMTQRFDQFLKDFIDLKLEFNTLSSFFEDDYSG
jgi:peptidoglycan/xylan/chitin deacetylase (PgdA/CDA1 family)